MYVAYTNAYLQRRYRSPIRSSLLESFVNTWYVLDRDLAGCFALVYVMCFVVLVACGSLFGTFGVDGWAVALPQPH